jgi:hypothetical protein
MAIGAQLAPIARQRILDALGNVVPGAKLYTYIAQTLTPWATASNSAGSAGNSNPIIADSGGLFPPIYLEFDQSYYFRLTDANDVLIWDQDNVPGGTGNAQTLTLTGAQNNLVVPAGVSLVRLNNAADLTLSGIGAGFDGQRLNLHSVGAGNVHLLHRSGLSVAANQLHNVATVGYTSLAAGTGSATYIYDATAAVWRLYAHEQGAALTPTFSAANFFAGGTQTWTVDAGDVVAYASYLKGRLLTLNWDILTSSVGGVPHANLILALPFNHVVHQVLLLPAGVVVDNGGARLTGLVQATTGQLALILYKDLTGATAYTASVNATALSGSITVEVQ